MASPTLVTPTASTPKPLLPPVRSKLTVTATATATTPPQSRRMFVSLAAGIILSPILPASPTLAVSDEEYVKDAGEVITRIRNTISKDRNDPDVADAVAQLRETSNSWVAKYRKEKALLGRSSFRDIYSALNAVSGHYISFGPTAPIPAKRRVRILEEMETAEKALQRGR
ncbi:photosystem II repair protein PSB27-H1, chloroplastic [Apium graveolens]|uniref:photosystem II repair protein PSB27-H1, chloroplastic n=1 Tax=Apium graveolens TaxID=4045 RepID=UPI003D7911F2